MRKQPLGIYVHIPFCVKKCAYCDFLSGPNTESRKEEYRKALLNEIHCYMSLPEKYEVVSIFFGGGTPSSLRKEQLVDVLDCIYETFGIDKEKVVSGEMDIEITVEANPGTLSLEKLTAYKEAGVNRLSIGLQSANLEELKLLGRIHTYDDFLESYTLAKQAGFHNINIDLMSALPGQTIASYEETLKKVLALSPTHISAYSLIVEEGTPFYERYGEDKPMESMLPTEEDERAMYVMTKELLHKHGYERYEISNYAKKGFACRHNSLYWTGTDYIGFGLGASSYVNGERYSNEADIKQYLQLLLEGEPGPALADRLKRDRNVLTKNNKMEEFMFLGLRMTEGVSLQKFKEQFGVSLTQVYGQVIEKHQQEGLLIEEKVGQEVYLHLTEKGLDVSNYVMADFLFE